LSTLGCGVVNVRDTMHGTPPWRWSGASVASPARLACGRGGAAAVEDKVAAGLRGFAHPVPWEPGWWAWCVGADSWGAVPGWIGRSVADGRTDGRAGRWVRWRGVGWWVWC
jgi:hypothetical protein